MIGRGGRLFERQNVADLRPCHPVVCGPEFQRREGAQRAGDAPRPHGNHALDHSPITGDEQDVDREAHAEGVNGVRRRDRQHRIGGQRAPAQQSAAARPRVECGLDPRCQHEPARPVHQLM